MNTFRFILALLISFSALASAEAFSRRLHHSDYDNSEKNNSGSENSSPNFISPRDDDFGSDRGIYNAGNLGGGSSEVSGRGESRRSSAATPKSVDAAGFRCALTQAQNYLRQNGGRKGLQNTYITLVDLNASSNTQRMVIVNANTGAIVESHTVASGSGGINSSAGSHGSELGFMRVGETYVGKHGLSARIDGLESGNRDARSRAIVIHGARYVREGGNAGRSWGCFALDNASVGKVIRRLKGGTLLYSYQGNRVCNK